MTWMPRQRRCRLMPTSRSAEWSGEEEERARCKLASATNLIMRGCSGANDSARSGDEPSDCPSLWPGRASPTPLPPLLVPVVRSRHGHGLALLGIVRELSAFSAKDSRPERRADAGQLSLPHLVLPDHHEVRSSDVMLRRLHGNLAAAADREPEDFSELLLTPGVGARTIRALAMVAEVVHGAPYRFSDPARFSLAHGGKDGHPFPVPLRVYDETIRVLKSAVQKAKLGREEELSALTRLDEQARRLERHATGPSVEPFIDEERRLSPAYGGRTVFGPAQPIGGAATSLPAARENRRAPAA